MAADTGFSDMGRSRRNSRAGQSLVEFAASRNKPALVAVLAAVAGP